MAEIAPGVVPHGEDTSNKMTHDTKLAYSASALLQLFDQMRQERRHCDVRLRIGDTVLKVHRVVLAAASPYFKAMFTGEWAEERVQEVTLHDVGSEIVQLIVDYIYTSRIPITVDNVEQVLSTANLYQLDCLKENCATLLSKVMEASNCVGILSIADAMVCTKLKEQAIRFTCGRFEDVAIFEEIVKLSKENLIEILSSDDLNVESEETPCRVALEWLEADATRSSDFHQVLVNIRLPFLSAPFLRDWLFNHKVIKTCVVCRTLIDEATWYWVMPESRQNDMQTSCTRPRTSYKDNI